MQSGGLREIGRELATHADEVLQVWDRLARDYSWIELPTPERRDHLPAVIRGLAEASLDPGGPDSVRVVAENGAKHGEDRRRQGIADDALFREYYYLRRAIWRWLEERHDGNAIAAEAILRLDTAITLATSASLLGYHREELARSGQWPQRLEQLIEENPLLHLHG